jgi:predicted nucleic acid binding AN1-type Zn finger protein
MRCAKCQKKLLVTEETIGKCKCTNVFCMNHRLPEQHTCIYDIRSEPKKEIQAIRSVKVIHI